jgi:hypothetical protein
VKLLLRLLLLAPPLARTPPSSQWLARRQRQGQKASHPQSACHSPQQQQECRLLLRCHQLLRGLRQRVLLRLHLLLPALRLMRLWRRQRGCLTRQHRHLQQKQQRKQSFGNVGRMSLYAWR